MKLKFIAALVLFLSALQLNAQTLWRSELLGRPTDSSITVNLFFSDSAEVRVQYGTVSGTYPFQTPWQTFADSVPAEIVINGLQPDTKYFYRIQYRQPGATGANNRPEFSFHTQRLTGSAFTFVVQADPHVDVNSDTALYRLCLQNQRDDNPDFMIDLGDFLMSDKLKDTATNTVPHDTVPYRCDLLRSFYEIECHSVPLYIANGNHEGESGWNLDGSPNNVAVWSSNERKKYFLNPAPDNFYSGDTTNNQYIGQRENYYSWTWGNAHFFVLDPFWYTTVKPDSLHGWRWTLGATQYNWLKTNLQNSTSTFKFVFAHHLIGGNAQGRGGVEYADFYEWGGANIDTTPGFATNRPGWYKPIKDLLTENRVNIFFHGHDHFFDEQIKDCLIYQETPQPSLPNFNYPNQAAQYGYLQGLIVGNSGHLRVTVDTSGTMVEYVRVYLPADTDATHHNKDVSATYFIGNVNCYDSAATGSPVIWNSNYAEDIVYPNPFSHETKIEFTLSEPEKINLDVYDSEGKFVRKLIAGNKISPGKFTVVWDGRDRYENDLASGIYYYSLLGEKTKASGKMILQR
jgi:hypothetical protein